MSKAEERSDRRERQSGDDQYDNEPHDDLNESAISHSAPAKNQPRRNKEHEGRTG
jgi:hypothetical protein